MEKLNTIPTKAFGFGLGFLVFDSLAMVCIVLFTGIALFRYSKIWARARTLYFGLVLLSLWSVLNWIDMVIRHTNAEVTYAYILTDCFFSIIRVVSDIFTLWGTLHVMIRYNVLRGRDVHLRLWILGGPLWFLGIYHVCLRFALAISWLSFADIETINKIAKAKNAFEIAFTALEFVISLFALLTSGASFLYDDVRNYMSFACLALWLRSFCELVITGELDRNPTRLNLTLRTRNVTYHLFSAAFAIFISYAIPKPSKRDPLLNQENFAITRVRDHVKKRISDDTKQGQNTAANIATVLYTPERAEPAMKTEYEFLRHKYKDWTPIYKWHGESNGQYGSSKL
ncbi:hypothetical protein BDV95DRAFT_210808 [Massariosphaeria phaeospora]|uniref:Uncharacterized protein n=1 Tax=Massariosphaeria phaeospora TaxID=100035 RepID=A0A7C8I711_9PLEO|nr:hypothetical protein BDV95DRAFT_210808 [Massariosphaeria phaeospora]